VYPRLELSTSPDPSNRLRGIFAKEAIAKGEELGMLPWKLVMALPEVEEELGQRQCHLVKKLRDELQSGRCSRYWPYLKMMNSHDVAIPNAWPADALLRLTRGTGNDGTLFDPSDGWRRHSNWFTEHCGSDLSDPLEVRALLLFVARADGHGLTPFYDMFNHRGGNWTSFDTSWTVGDRVLMTASRAVAKGAQLYNWFGDGAPDTFRDYGFVEQTPALWYFFAQDRKHEWTIQDDAGLVQWPNSAFDDSSYFQTFIDAAEALLARIEKAGAKDAGKDDTFAQMADAYHSAFSIAVRLAVADARARLLAAPGQSVEL